MNTKTNDIIRNIFLRSIAVMIASNITMFAGSLVDSVLISRFLGAECMAAYGIVAPVNLLIVMVSLVFSSGLQNTCAGLLATGKAKEAGEKFSASIILEVGIALIVALIMIFFRSQVADLLLMGRAGAGELKSYVSAYLLGLAPGMIVLCILPSLSFLMYVEGKGNVVIQSVIIQMIVNIAGDLLNVFAIKGGMTGMGVATSLCYYCAMIAFVIAIRHSSGALKFSFKGVSLTSALPVIREGAPTAAERLYASVRTIILNSLLLTLSGSNAVASFSIMVTLQSIYNSVSMGIASTTQTAVSAFAKEEDEASLKDILKISISYGLIIEIVLAVIVFLTAPLVTCLFVADRSSENFTLTVSALKLFALSIPFYNLNSTLQKYYQGIGQFRLTYVFSCLNNFVFLIASAFILGNMFGTDGVWISFMVTELCTLVVVLLSTWIRSRRVTFALKDYMNLPPGFADFSDKGLYGTAADRNELSRFSEEIYHYCLTGGAATRTAMLSALTVEEMGGNIIQWGFKGGNRHLDMRIVRKDSEWILRIRDDCAQFNPSQWLQIHHPEDPSKNIGIRMVFAMAKDIKYVNLLGMNQLVLRIVEGQ